MFKRSCFNIYHQSHLSIGSEASSIMAEVEGPKISEEILENRRLEVLRLVVRKLESGSSPALFVAEKILLIAKLLNIILKKGNLLSAGLVSCVLNLIACMFARLVFCALPPPESFS